MYHGLPQLSNFGPDGHIVILANNRPITPALTTIANINANQHLAQLIRLEGVSFVDQEGTFAPTTGYGERYIQDAYGNTAMVRTSNYANFAANPLPQGTGNLVAIASLYNTTWQLTLRSYYELEFDGMGPGIITPGEVQSLPYTQLFSTGFGSYMTYSVLGDEQFWKIDYSSAYMTGHEKIGNDHFYYDNEDWLISSPVEITGVEHAKAVINYAAKYTAPIDGDVTLQVSENYEYGNDPSMASWVELPERLENNSPGTSWDFSDREVNLDQFIGETVTFAVRFISTTSGSRTIEIKSITISDGEAGDTPTPSTQGEGSGTADDPYNVAAGISQQTSLVAWVKGYIVGAVKSGPSSVSSNDDVDWSAPFSRATNVLIADDPNCNEVSNCIIVELVPSGSPLRTQVNLVDNPQNLGKTLAVYGKLRTYFGQAGLRDSAGTEEDFVLEGGDTPTPPDPGTTEYFNQTLTTQDSYNTFTAYNVLGEQEWYQNNSHLEYGAVMSGYANNTSYANEDWFISPVIDLSGSTSPILNFEHARGPQDSMNVGVEDGYYTVWVTNDYTDGVDPNQDRWVELPILNQPSVKWQFVSAGDLVIPAEFKTSTCRIAFRYLSVDGASATWEIKNVVVKEQ